MREVSVCPICNGKSFRHFIHCKDYTVSQETFPINQCTQCQFLVTTPTPEINKLGNYYLSDSYISHAAQSPSLQDKAYKLARSITLKWKLKLINSHTSTGSAKTLLDFGCGTGQFLQKCQSNGWQINGIEPSDHARRLSSEITKTTIASSLDFVSQSSFNTITLWHVLEHIPNLNETIQMLKQALTDSGTLFIAVPNRNSWDAKHYSTHWAAYDVPRHLWHFSQSNMAQLLTNHNLKLIKTVPMKLDAFYVTLLSEKYKYKPSPITFLRAILNGFRSNSFAQQHSEYSSLIYIVRK